MSIAPPPTSSVPLLLDRQPFLVLDVQTTGASPARGHLLEVAWAWVRAADVSGGAEPAVESHVVALPPGEAVPRRIEGLTGIGPDVLALAEDAARVWRRLEQALGGARPVQALAHLARFERSFLEDLHVRTAPGRPFPLTFLCTHEIACRLYPELPRRGLRALAGRLGHPMGSARRATDHVRATAHVWAGIVERLRAKAGVVDDVGLARFLAEVEPRRRGGRSFAVPRSVRLELPDAPGVYRMQGKRGNVLYVGKATSLKRRVNGYFQKRRHSRAPMLEMLTQVFELDVTPTATALEAALLEPDEIKRLDPPYNVQLRPREASFVFLDPHALAYGERATEARRLGPLPRERVDELVAVDAVLTGSAEDADPAWRRAIGMADDAEPDPRVLASGRRQFLETHGTSVLPGGRAATWIGLGDRLWRERLREDEAPASEDDVEATPEREARDGPWVPTDADAVQAALERTVLGVAHVVRRARLSARFSECALCWHPPGREVGAPARRLVMDGGRVSQAEDTPFAVPPPPPGWPRSRLRRARGFDLAAWDRMRVFLTELGRLVAAETDIVCRLGPHQVLDPAALAARLAWV